MKYQTVTEAAKSLGITRGRLHQLIQARRVPGAKKVGSVWIVPDPIRLKPGLNRGLPGVASSRPKSNPASGDTTAKGG